MIDQPAGEAVPGMTDPEEDCSMYKLMAVPLLLMGLTGCAGVAFMGQGV